MRRSRHVAAPLLASAALELLAGCRQTTCIANNTHEAVAMFLCRDTAGTPIITRTYHLETQSGGFGQLLAPILLISGIAALRLFGSGS